MSDMLLDLGVEVGNELQQAEYLPPELIGALGRLGMGLIFSVVQLPRGSPGITRVAGSGVPIRGRQNGTWR